ncbi:RiPP maturation radical SAM C-methyltransferase [Thalassotalea castellviae]|uniref:RiPP maturation radical SAM C-methyltransferase n=1 Tax=Thalassotalea castellviae TaxID=3075612 RepID=A0ABU3A6B5_9GAMM|nr:RiPP maturation radical SAM C-methyltransferase [Thalassotalea sp. W431]MDT0604516.1 RiPP maturation radical SAM C-methyltransferase [Thalassotalea sp. W431]
MKKNIYLVNMPYSSLTHPSLALGLIEKYILAYGHQSEVIYANLAFAKIIGLAQYDVIDSSYFEQLIGEWTFSRAAFPEKIPLDHEFFALFSDITPTLIEQLKQVREEAELYIKNLSQEIIQHQPKIVACTSTFQQNCASLALLREIKKQSPSTITILGGANCESIMGQTISENFNWVDYVFSGECDAVIGEFVDKIMNDEPIGVHNLPHGFIAQGHSDLLITQSAKKNTPPRGFIEDMSQVGVPIYDSYFQSLSDLNLSDNISAGLLIETSRGCWWGAKKHCTFCGLNGVSMEHRAKKPEDVLAEFEQLSSTYHNNKFEVVDNILPMEYMKTVLPELSKNQDYNIFYETKSNLKKEHIEQLANSGIKWIQPGFESLHDGFLKLIDKGVTGIQNISALKYCRNSGIVVIWNLLFAAPFEESDWYDEMAEILPLISHLQPPNKELCQIRFPRFSPYFKTPQKYGLILEPLKSYQYIYPLEGKELFDIAYFFDHISTKTTKVFHLSEKPNHVIPAHQRLQEQLNDWVNQWQQSSMPLLYMSDQGDKLVIIDTRKVATNFTHQLTGMSADIYRLCQEPITKNRLLKKLEAKRKIESLEQIESNLTSLINDKLLLSLSNCYLSLALMGNTPALPDYKNRPAGHLNISTH